MGVCVSERESETVLCVFVCVFESEDSRLHEKNTYYSNAAFG